MGIIQWWNDRKAKPAETVQEAPKAVPENVLSDDVRVKRYVEDGGEIVDLSNKPRLENDGFVSDRDLIQPFNRAHTGTKKGLSDLMKGGKR